MSALLIFRKGLRLHDNPALLEALKGSNSVYPVFVFDPWFAGNGKVGTNRFSFLLESLADLNESFKARGSRLLIVHGDPPEVVPKLIKAWNISKVCYERDTEAYSKSRDTKMNAAIEATETPIHSFVSHTLYDTDKLLQLNKGQVVTAYSAFQRLAQKSGSPGAPVVDPPSQLPPIPSNAADALRSVGLKEDPIPTLKDLGYNDEPTSVFKGGETLALKRLDEHLADKKWVVQFEKPKGNPAALQPATTVLSPYLKFGCLSVRLFHKRLQEIEKEFPSFTKPPVSLRGQLLWREFFYFVGAHTPNFDQMEGNPVCKQIPWEENVEKVLAWEQGLMLACASYKFTGDLYCPWTAGRDVFDRLLIDDDWSLNNANWMWLSASAFFYQYHRVYSPVTFGKKYDPNGDFVRQFVPELKDFPAKYIYEPWKAPIADQKAANCRIGVDYPKPICDHAKVSKENVQKLKEAYANQPPHGKSPSKAKAGAAGLGAVDGASVNAVTKESSQHASSQQQRGQRAKQTSSDRQAPAGEALQQPSETEDGFDDVAVPDGAKGSGNHETDAQEPEASLPGGAASKKSKQPLSPADDSASPEPKHKDVQKALAKQKKLDWTAVAAAGEKKKRKADEPAEADSPKAAARRSPRQKKIKFSPTPME